MTLVYRWRRRLGRYAQDGVHPQRHQAQAGPPVQLAPETERLLLNLAVSEATCGASRIAAYGSTAGGCAWPPARCSGPCAARGWRPAGSGSWVLEQRALQTAGLLSERTRRTVWQAQHGQPRHVAAREPGELVCLDTFYIGQLQGVGKVWQIMACDAACSYGVAWLLLPTPPGPASGPSSREYTTF